MDRNPATLIAFGGPAIDQDRAVVELAERYECWNLKQFAFEQFIETIKAKIPPVNLNVLRNYVAATDDSQFGVTEHRFKTSAWGLLIPESVPDAIASGNSEALFLVNLYSPTFLYPVFTASDFGIMGANRRGPLPLHLLHSQDQARVFRTPAFVAFFRAMLPQSQYDGSWFRPRAERWTKEDWRLFVAAMLFNGLKEYDNSKDSIGWQRESADMAAVLEALFTAADKQRDEIGYRLRKRVAVLLSHRYPTIEADIRDLYNQRSDFIHGSFFADLPKQTKRADGDPPSPDFSKLNTQTNHVRIALTAYLYLARQLSARPGVYGKASTVMEALENAIINVDLREAIVKDAETVLSLMPQSPG